MRCFLIGFAGLIYFATASVDAFAEAPLIEEAFSPHQGATQLVIKAIGEAQKSIHLAGYSFTSKPIGSALVEAHNRGVEVEIVLDKSQQNSHEAEWVSAQGVPIRINYNYSIMHDKFIVVDEETVELGSFNFTAAAENKNAENVLVIHHATDVAEAYSKQWQKLWAEGQGLQISPKEN